MRVKITDVHPRSCNQHLLNCIVEIKEGEIKASVERERLGWFEAWVNKHGETNQRWIYGFKYEPVEEPAMSKLVQRVKVAFDVYYANKNKKLSWLQKIRGYDWLEIARNDYQKLYYDMKARCQAAESMKYHYKEIMTEALRDRDLHAKVADNWQAKLIEANNKYDLLERANVIGRIYDKMFNSQRRLKFSVGHNHVEIIVGNPITLCSNYRTEDKHGDYTDNAISRCSEKDEYNWKLGAIQSVDNLCDEHKYTQKLRRDLRKALAKKYPEVFEK